MIEGCVIIEGCSLLMAVTSHWVRWCLRHLMTQLGPSREGPAAKTIYFGRRAKMYITSIIIIIGGGGNVFQNYLEKNIPIPVISC